jgi:hypothetical protein
MWGISKIMEKNQVTRASNFELRLESLSSRSHRIKTYSTLPTIRVRKKVNRKSKNAYSGTLPIKKLSDAITYSMLSLFKKHCIE